MGPSSGEFHYGCAPAWQGDSTNGACISQQVASDCGQSHDSFRSAPVEQEKMVATPVRGDRCGQIRQDRRDPRIGGEPREERIEQRGRATGAQVVGPALAMTTSGQSWPTFVPRAGVGGEDLARFSM